jgi:hypothetical protein
MPFFQVEYTALTGPLLCIAVAYVGILLQLLILVFENWPITTSSALILYTISAFQTEIDFPIQQSK